MKVSTGDAPLHVPENAACRLCGYPLCQLTTPRCPECGSAFNPDDSSTFHLPRQRSWLKVARPPGRMQAALWLLLVFWAIWDNTIPGWHWWRWFGGCGQLFALVVLGLVLNVLIRAALLGIARRRRLKPPEKPQRSRWNWLFTPLGLAILFSVMLTDWPLCVRFGLSRGAFDAKLAQYRARGAGTNAAERVGLYRVQRVCLKSDGSILFHIHDTYDFKGRIHLGFEALPAGTPVNVQPARHDPLLDDDPNGWHIGSLRFWPAPPQ